MEHKGFWVHGVVAPVFFALAVLVLGTLKPGYSHVYNTISELGEIGSITAQPASLVFIATGIMITIFGVGLHLRLRREKHVLSGILVILYGLLDYVGSGLFPIEAGGAATTLVSTFHVYATVLGEFLAVAMPLWFLYDTEGVDGWDEHRRFSKVVFWVSMPLIAFLGYCVVGHTPGVVDVPIGLAQRLLVGLFLLWILVTAYRLKAMSQ